MLWPKKNSYTEFDNEKKIPAAQNIAAELTKKDRTLLQCK